MMKTIKTKSTESTKKPFTLNDAIKETHESIAQILCAIKKK